MSLLLLLLLDSQLTCCPLHTSDVGTPISSICSSRASCVSSCASTSTLVAEEGESTTEGRIPTPKIKQGRQGQRHHLDRTTPAVGGALLTSPPRPQGRDESASDESEIMQRTLGPKVSESQHTQAGRWKRERDKICDLLNLLASFFGAV